MLKSVMEKRRSKRKIRRLEIKFITRDDGLTGITSNLSKEGLFIRTQKGLPPGTVLNLSLYLPSGEAVKLSGKVIRTVKTQIQSLKNGMGIELSDSPEIYIDLYGDED
jgi:uncharacterized protein (TIGR02266 family)